VEIQRLQKEIELLPVSYRGQEGQEVHRLIAKQMAFEIRQLKLKGIKELPLEEAMMDAEKERKKVARSKMGKGYRRPIVRKKND